MTETLWTKPPQRRDSANFGNLLAVLRREVPTRPTLFEFILNDDLYRHVVPGPEPIDALSYMRRVIRGYHALGYEHATIQIPGLSFQTGMDRHKEQTVSLNEGAPIHNRQDFNRFQWPDPEAVRYELLDEIALDLPDGMKVIPFSSDGVLENSINLLGYESLCYLLADDPQLVEDVFNGVGSRLLRYYQRIVQHETIGAIVVNDDWGFKTNSLLSPKDMRRLVFPWHRQIVEAAHEAGLPAILHSCGYFEHIIDDIVDIGFDGRHSYEDNILPVEEAYERYHQRIAILGGLDIDFICRSEPQEVYQRAGAMLDRCTDRGGYALGTGNSVPSYVPLPNYFAMIQVVWDSR